MDYIIYAYDGKIKINPPQTNCFDLNNAALFAFLLIEGRAVCARNEAKIKIYCFAGGGNGALRKADARKVCQMLMKGGSIHFLY